ncbi:MAG: CDGSH iron-sulfur domain-containing protein [Candidatus Tectomicrobia bacterium]|nr:CDGSH iron-sulfur domain-containing protein [Candidatus Tectomicrobia bacterium]
MDRPNIAQRGPYEYTAEKDGKVAWCACGLSKSQPFCDGSHKVTPFRPVIAEIKAGETYWFCGCKQTGSKPMCDGTHATL